MCRLHPSWGRAAGPSRALPLLCGCPAVRLQDFICPGFTPAVFKSLPYRFCSALKTLCSKTHGELGPRDHFECTVRGQQLPLCCGSAPLPPAAPHTDPAGSRRVRSLLFGWGRPAGLDRGSAGARPPEASARLVPAGHTEHMGRRPSCGGRQGAGWAGRLLQSPHWERAIARLECSKGRAGVCT